MTEDGWVARDIEEEPEERTYPRISLRTRIIALEALLLGLVVLSTNLGLLVENHAPAGPLLNQTEGGDPLQEISDGNETTPPVTEDDVDTEGMMNPRPGILATIWERSYGSDWDEGFGLILETPDGYLLGGTAKQNEGPQKTLVASDIHLIRTDGDGEVIWDRQYLRDGLESADGIAPAADGGYVVVGHAGGLFYMVKIGGDGVKEWERSWGRNESNVLRCIIPTGSGGFLVAGYTGGLVSATNDLYVAKIDEAGKIQWERTCGGSQHDSARCMASDSLGGAVVAGYSDRGEDRSLYLVRIGPDGGLIWERVYHYGYWDEANDILECPGGGHVIVGKTGKRDSYGDIYLLRIDGNGETLWERDLAGKANDGLTSVAKKGVEGFVAVGYTYSFEEGTYLLEFDDEGEIIWETTLPDAPTRAIIPDGEGFLLVGSMEQSDGERDVFLLKVALELST